MSNQKGHIPVLISEIIELFQPKEGDVLLDATLGHGGHAKAFLEATGGKGEVVGIEIDPEAVTAAKKNLSAFKGNVKYINSNFWQLKDSLIGGGILPSTSFNYVLFDLGLGSHQLADPARGFSFHSKGPLSMRFGQSENLPLSDLSFLNDLTAYLGRLPDAADITSRLNSRDLTELIRKFGEERFAGRIASAIKATGHIQTAEELAGIIEKAVPKDYEKGRIHPATRTFQALRLAVNRELEVVKTALPQALEVLDPDGLLAVISFHSLEDRLVKRFFKREASKCLCPPEYPECVCKHEPSLKILTKQPITASQEERGNNIRARTAKLRAARKI